VTIALCSTYTIAESDPRWYETLKSVQILRVTYLRADEARRVLTAPAPDFPAGVYSEAAIDRALGLTSGHPFLLHLLGQAVVSAYNQELAEPGPAGAPSLPLPASAVDAALPTILAAGELYFLDRWTWLLRISGDRPLAAALLQALAHDQPIEQIGDPSQRAELLKRFAERDLLYLDESSRYQFRVPLISQWIAQQRRLPGL
jgi:hypothetical protein